MKIIEADIKNIGGVKILYEPHLGPELVPVYTENSNQTYALLKNEVSCFHAPIIGAWVSVRYKDPSDTYVCPDSSDSGSFIEKLYSDCLHQNGNGMALDAMVFYTILTRRSASTLKPIFTSNMENPELYEEFAQIAYNT
jgi:hypothetical protein